MSARVNNNSNGLRRSDRPPCLSIPTSKSSFSFDDILTMNAFSVMMSASRSATASTSASSSSSTARECQDHTAPSTVDAQAQLDTQVVAVVTPRESAPSTKGWGGARTNSGPKPKPNQTLL